MVDRFRQFFVREIRGLHEAAYVLGVFAIASQLLGFVRDRLLAGTFGAGAELDVYYTAFRIPDFLYVTISSLVSVSVLVPFIIDRAKQDNALARRFISSVFTAFTIGMLVVGGIAFLAMPTLIKAFFFEIYAGPYGEECIAMARVLLLSPLLLGVSNLFGSIAQAHRRFVLYALSPVAYNAGIVAGILWLYPRFGLLGLAFGVAIGAFLHVLVQLPAMTQDSLVPRLIRNVDWKAVGKVILVSVPRTGALAASQLSILVCLSIASTVSVGSISVFTLAFNLQSVPMSIVGVSYSLAAFPVLAALFANGQRKEFVEQLSVAARHIIFWSLPVAVLFLVLRAQIVRTVLGTGAFSWGDTRLTAACLALFAVSVLAQSLVVLFTRAYYCAGRTTRPLTVNLVAAAITIVGSIGLIAMFEAMPWTLQALESFFRIEGVPGSAVIAIPLSYSLGALINAAVLWVSFERENRGFSADIWRPAVEGLLGALVMGYVAYLTLNATSDAFDPSKTMGVFLHGLTAGITGIIAGAAALWVVGNAEIRDVGSTLRKRVWRVRPVVDQTVDEHVVS
jgi:putative peptidoglycan lipid II flippase